MNSIQNRNKLMVTKGEGEGGRDKLGVLTGTNYYIYIK